jgi:GntR family transcriptional regulator
MLATVTLPFMPIEIDPHSGVPSYVQLVGAIRERIKAGEYGPREPIPSIKQLIGETGLAKGTVVHAMDVLEDEGLIYRVPGRGTFVRPKT